MGGALGPTAMERALLDHLGVGRTLSVTDLVGLVAWCAVRRPAGSQPTPNATPWAHLGSLAHLVDELRHG